jgi:hypothetical protein
VQFCGIGEVKCNSSALSDFDALCEIPTLVSPQVKAAVQLSGLR